MECVGIAARRIKERTNTSLCVMTCSYNSAPSFRASCQYTCYIIAAVFDTMSLPISHCEYHGVQLRRSAFYQCLLPSLVPRPPPRFYLAAIEKNPRLRDKIWGEAWERGYLLLTCMLHYSSCIWQVLCPCLSELKFLACLVFINCEFHKDIQTL